MLFVINKWLDYGIMTTTRTGFAASHEGWLHYSCTSWQNHRGTAHWQDPLTTVEPLS